MKTSRLNSSTFPRDLLIRLMAAHFLGTFFAYTVYINLSSLGDGYIPESFEGFTGENISFSSTLVVHGIYAYLGAFLPGFLAPLVLGLVVAILIWHAFRNVYTQIHPKLFWACNLLPHFLVWSGSSSKEQIVIICGIIIINFSVKRLFLNVKLSINIIFVLISLWFIYIIRPNYFVIYFTIFVTSFFSSSINRILRKRLTIGLWILVFIFVVFGLGSIMFLDAEFTDKDIVVFMKGVEHSFLAYTDSNSNRYGIQWNDLSDFMFNALWGVPQGFIGPTLPETIVKPYQLPAFIEGVIHIFLLFYLFFKLVKIAHKISILRLHIMLFFFVSLVVVFISYPYLIFNPGSALRYKQSMHPILMLYPLLILAYARAKNLKVTTN